MFFCRRWMALAALVLSPTVVWGQADEQTADKAAADKPKDAGVQQPAAGTQKWEFGVSIRAVGGPCSGLFGTFAVPSDWPEQQVKVLNEDITAQVVRHSYREGDGLKQMLFEVPQLASGDTATCYLTLEITKRPQPPPADPSGLVIPKDPPRDIKKFLLPSPLVESTGAKAKSLAKELTADKETAWEQVKSIAQGVRDRVRFEPDPKNVMKGAVGALRDGKADKEDLTATFVAICRAAKIPARCVWVMDFCYAEFYLADAAGQGAWYPYVVHLNGELGACKDVRPILEKGDNFKVPEEKAPQRFVREFLTGKGGGGKPSVEFRRRRAD
jgi:transglutaminase superfamily protein